MCQLLPAILRRRAPPAAQRAPYCLPIAPLVSTVSALYQKRVFVADVPPDIGARSGCTCSIWAARHGLPRRRHLGA